MLRNIAILSAGPFMQLFSSIIPISVIFPSAGAKSRFLSAGLDRLGSRKKASAQIRMIASIDSIIMVVSVVSGKTRSSIIVERIAAGMTITSGRPYLVSGILIIRI